MKTEKIKNIASVLMTLIFVLMLVGAMIWSVISKKNDESYYENRTLAALPKPTLQGAMDGSLFGDVGTYLKDHAPGRESLLATNTWIDLNVLHRPVVNDIYVGEDILLPYFSHETVDYDTLSSTASDVADRFSKRAQLVESFGGEYYFAALPCQYTCYADRYPDYLNNREEYLTAAKEVFLSELEERGICAVDMGETYNELGCPEYFSSTVDHHYGIMGAYQTYKTLLGLHNEKNGDNVEVLSEDDFEITYLPNKYVGSRLRKIFGMWESEEKLGILTMKSDIPYVRRDNGNDVASYVYKLPETETEDVLYTAYMGGDVAHTVIDTGREELPTVLIYGESFTNAIECFAWYGFDEMHSLDLRYSAEGAFETLVEEIKPDIVICVRDYSVLLVTEGYGH